MKITYIRVLVSIFGSAFCLAGGIGQGEHHGPLIVIRHGAQDFRCENAGSSRGTNKHLLISLGLPKVPSEITIVITYTGFDGGDNLGEI